MPKIHAFDDPKEKYEVIIGRDIYQQIRLDIKIVSINFNGMKGL